MSLATTLSSAAASEPAEADATTVVGRVAGDTLEGTPAVTIEGVTKTFDAATGPVIEDLSLQVAQGELVAVLGASGCGKSTLLGMVAGLDRPTRGRIVTPHGRPALMFQDASLFPWLTARGNVELALRLRRGGARLNRHDRRAEAERWLDLVRLGLTVLFVTHNVREAVRLGDRVVLLASRPGRIVREWTVPIPHPRRIESPAVGALAVEITEQLRQEIRRHAR